MKKKGRAKKASPKKATKKPAKKAAPRGKSPRKKGAGPLERIGYAAGRTVGKIASLAGKTTVVLKEAADRVIDKAKKSARKK